MSVENNCILSNCCGINYTLAATLSAICCVTATALGIILYSTSPNLTMITSYLIGSGTVAVLSFIGFVICAKKSCDPAEERKKIDRLFPGIKEKMRFPDLIADLPQTRRTQIAKLSEEEFTTLCKYLFESSEGKEMVAIQDSILADLKAYKNWEAVIDLLDEKGAWKNAILQAKPSVREK